MKFIEKHIIKIILFLFLLVTITLLVQICKMPNKGVYRTDNVIELNR